MSYHNHTNWSDGKASLAEMLAGAREMNLNEVGISDHLTLFADERPCYWSMPLSFLPCYASKLARAAAAETSGLKIRIGIEADFFADTVDTVIAALGSCTFDYVISSLHFSGDFPVDEKAEDWAEISEEQSNEIWRRYWIDIASMAEHRLGDIIGHLDLPKKFGTRPSVDLSAEENHALEAIACSGAAIEINTAGWHVPAAEAYPSLSLLTRAFEKKIPLVISADAHTPQHLLRDFDRALLLAKEAGYSEIVRFERREKICVPI